METVSPNESFSRAAHAAIASRLSRRTKESYERALRQWLDHCASAKCDPADPTLDVAAAFRDGFAQATYKARSGRKRRYKPTTVRDYLAALSFIYRRLVAQRPAAASWNPFDPEALAWPVASHIGLTEELRATDAERMIQSALAAGMLRDVALLRVLYDTGARRMSVIGMRRDGLRRRGKATVARIAVKGSSGSQLAELPLPEKASIALRAWLAEAPQSVWVFPGRDRSVPMNLSMVNKIVSRWGEAAGVEHAHPHRFRATFITDAYSLGLSPRDIQASVHHMDPRSTQRYDRGQRGIGVADAVSKRRGRRRKK